MLKQISKNISSGWIQILLSVIFTIIITPIAINNLGRESYGLWLLVFNIVGYLYLADFGVTNAVSRIYAKYNILNDKKKLGSLVYAVYLMIVLIDIAIVLLALLFYDNIMIFLNVSDNMQSVFIVLFIIAIIEVVTQLILRINVGILQGVHKFHISYNLNSISIIIRFISIFVLLYFDSFNIINFAIVYTSSKILTNLLTFFYLKKELKSIIFKSDKSIFKEITNLGTSSLIISLSAVLYNSVPTLLYGKIFGISNVIIYAIPISIMLLVSKFINIIFIAAVPRVSELKTLSDSEGIYKISDLGIRVSLFINIVSIIFFIFFAKDLLILWLGNKELNLNDFAIMYHILILLIGYLSFSNLQKINNIIFKSAGLHWIATWEMVLSVIILYLFSLYTFELFNEYVFAVGMLLVGVFKFLFYKYVGRDKITISTHSRKIIFLNTVFIIGLYLLINIFIFTIYEKIFMFTIVFASYSLYSFKYILSNLEKDIIMKKIRSKI